jgi:hypothetical protein
MASNVRALILPRADPGPGSIAVISPLVNISAEQLAAFANKRVHAMSVIAPTLTLAEQLVLMATNVPRHQVAGIVALCGEAHGAPRNYKDTARSLERAGLITQIATNRRLAPTEAARIRERWTRVLRVVRDTATPATEDADLLLGLAASGALTIGQSDRMRARHHMTSLTTGDRHLTPFARVVCDYFGHNSVSSLAEVLLRPVPRFSPGAFDPGDSGAWGAMGDVC